MTLPQIIVPVFNAFEMLGPCLRSIARTVPAEAKVLLIDDASTDPRVRPVLQAWTNESPQQSHLLVHKQNQGFVRTANHGMSLADADLVLLNSDTVVTNGWLQGLARCLSSGSDIATATPWSNNGEIVSIPDFCKVNPPPVDPEAVAATIAACGTPVYPDMPTAVGFCMAISSRATKAIGGFDEKTFGRGYGEENDFCSRAAEAGMRNVLCDDTYVIHHGGASFSPLGLKPDEESMQRLLAKHPAYQQIVSDFIRQDPLATRRQQLLACLERAGIRMR